MDFELDDDQLALRAAARDLLGRHASSDRVRAVVDAGGGIDADLWSAMVEQGWPGIAVAEADGGAGFGFVEAVVLFEEVGAHVAPAPVVESVLAAACLAGTEWLAPLVAGEIVASAPWDDGPSVVPWAPVADIAVGVKEGRLVLADLREQRPAAEPAMDRTRTVGWHSWSDRPTVELAGGDAARAHLDRGAVAYAACLLGASQRMLDATVQYAKDRVQFGRPIGSFQAVKHRCAGMLVDVEGMRSAVYWAAWCVANDDGDASVAASTAKAWCSDAARRVMASALQVHGGIGFTWEHDLHLYLKRAHLDERCFGDATHHRSRLAGLLRSRVEAGEGVL